MSTIAEKISAQRMAFNDRPTRAWHRHIIGPTEMETLIIADAENRQRGLTLATLCDMVIGEDAKNRSDAALIAAVVSLTRGDKP